MIIFNVDNGILVIRYKQNAFFHFNRDIFIPVLKIFLFFGIQ